MSARPRRVGPTALDVARLAGVAPATAARVLGNYGSVSPAVRERVLKAAASLRYRSNRVARSMVTGLTQTLGVVIANIEDEFFSRIVRGIADAARVAGFDVILMNSDEDVDEEGRAVRALMEKQVDGLIVAPASTQIPEHLVEVRESGMPIVLLDRNLEGLDTDSVVTDGVEAAATAVNYLIELGHRHIAIITDIPEGTELPSTLDPPNRVVTTGARLAGYLGALEQAGIVVDDSLIGRALPTVEGAREQTHALLDRCAPSADPRDGQHHDPRSSRRSTGAEGRDSRRDLLLRLRRPRVDEGGLPSAVGRVSADVRLGIDRGSLSPCPHPWPRRTSPSARPANEARPPRLGCPPAAPGVRLHAGPI